MPPHLMFYAANKTAKDIGYEALSPTMVPYLTHPGEPEALLVVMQRTRPPQEKSSDASHKH